VVKLKFRFFNPLGAGGIYGIIRILKPQYLRHKISQIFTDFIFTMKR
jgi:hypothetical protein